MYGKTLSFSPVILKQEERKSGNELLERKHNDKISAGIREFSRRSTLCREQQGRELVLAALSVRGSAVFHYVSVEKPSHWFKELKVINNAESVSKEKIPVCHHQ